MKKCTQCNRTYSDESLNFCLDDGTVLIADSERATNENIQRPTEQQTEILSYEQVTEAVPLDRNTKNYADEGETVVKSQPAVNNSQPQIIKQGVSPMFAYLSVGLLALVVLLTGIGLAFWLKPGSNNDANLEFAKTNSNENDSNQTSGDLDGKADRVAIDLNDTERSKTKENSKKESSEPPKKEKDDQTTNPNPTPTDISTPTPDPNPTKSPEPEKGKFFVILGSFQDSGNAKKRLMLARSRGLPARIVNTSNVPGLRSGLQAVVLGPFSKSQAQNMLGKARSVASDAYVKAGN